MKIYVVSILSSVSAIVLNLLLKNYYVDIIALVLVLSVGIMHGANDLLIIEKLKVENKQLNLNKYRIGYITIVLLVLGLFYFIPWFILLAFIVVSAYHFGEQQLQISTKISHPTAKFLFFLYGVSVLIGLFYFNSVETIQIINDITKSNASAIYFQSLFIISLFLTLVYFIYLLIQNIISIKYILKEIFSMLIIFALFSQTNLLLGFAVYFVFWHTIPSLKDQIGYIYKETSQQTLLAYVKKALPIWLISISGLFMLYFLFGEENMFLSIMFAFIAAVTFPHVLVIEQMFSKINQFNY